MRQAQDCFHCGEPVPPGLNLSVEVDGVEQPVCCTGCHAVANTILGAGLDAFYRFRPAPTGQPEDLAAADARRYASFDQERVQQDFVYQAADGTREAAVLVEGLYCAACGWLIEKSLSEAEGVEDIRVNPATGRAILRWNPETVPLSSLMAHMGRLGYKPHPVLPETSDSQTVKERRSALRRLIVAGLGMMQAMMFAVALYSGQFHGMDEIYEDFLRGVSMLVATPVVLYAGLPIFMGAFRDLRNGRPGMDVPVAIAIGGAYSASVWITFAGGPEVYFDSVSMFTFFLLTARYVEMAARHRANATTDALGRLVPSTAVRLGSEGEEEIPLRDVDVGDELLVRPGATIPADGRILAGSTSVDESMLTGESEPQPRGVDSPVVGGSLNLGSSIRMRVEHVGQDTMVSHIGRLLRRAQSERPSLAKMADVVARWFVTLVLIAAATVFALWWQIDPSRAFHVTLAMLVATCPCALSLAMPTALAAGTNRLATEGLLVTRADALETLAKVSHVVMDKTGTLTEGRLDVVDVRPAGGLDKAEAMALAAALEHHSEHPIASAFPAPSRFEAEHTEVTRGGGVEGLLDGRTMRIGRPDWVAELSGTQISGELQQGAWIALGDHRGLVASFRLADRLRPEAEQTIASFRKRGVSVEIASGDAPEPVREAARELGIHTWHARMSPEDKLARLRQLQSQGAVVLMVGDGINDAPVLAGANVSAALNEGTALAQTTAGMILLGGKLSQLSDGLETAGRTLRTIRQNLILSACYNASMLPLAAMGFIPPWLAATGMTLSSLVVVLNSRRLAGRRPHQLRCPVPAETAREGQPA